jgi:hypothetical protein
MVISVDDLNLCQRIRWVCSIVSLAVLTWLLHVDARAVRYYNETMLHTQRIR